MKILTYVIKIYEPERHLLTNDKSGLSLYVHDIVRYLARKSETYVLTCQPTRGAIINGIHYLKHKKRNLLKWNSILAIFSAIYIFVKTSGSIKYRLKCSYYRLDLATFRHALETIRPDIVNIHGCHLQIQRQIEICKSKHVPFVISLHGLIGIDSTVKASPELKAIEGVVLRKADEERWPIVAISSGVKKRAVDFYGLKNPDNITVILNGTEIIDNPPCQPVVLCDSLIRSGKKIVTCVGGLSKRKNQTQLVDAWSQLPEDIRKQYSVIFFGNDLTKGEISAKIDSMGLNNEMYVYGFARKEEVNYAYEHACLNVLASIDEGFGLSIIEAMSFGVPSVIFNDIDAAVDLYNENTILLVNDRSTETFSLTILNALKKKWNRESIIKNGKLFSMENVCEKYLLKYETVIEESYNE